MSKSIWFEPFTTEDTAPLLENTMPGYLGMQIVEVGDDFLKASMPVSERVVQPMGLVHGGANVALAETVGSIAASLVVDRSRFVCLGQEINANHLRGVRSGTVTAIARPDYLGRSSQVWDIRLFDDRHKLTCVSRLTMAVISRDKLRGD